MKSLRDIQVHPVSNDLEVDNEVEDVVFDKVYGGDREDQSSSQIIYSPKYTYSLPKTIPTNKWVEDQNNRDIPENNWRKSEEKKI